MNRKWLHFAVAFLAVMILFCSAQAESIQSHEITKDLDRIKTKHDTGFVKEEDIQNDLHSGWGLGIFYVQGYSKMAYDAEGIPVFLLQEGNQIMLGFNLKQNLNALGGNSSFTLNSDSNGYDSEFGIERTNFGKGCLILQRTDPSGVLSAPILYPDYLSQLAQGSSGMLIGPLEEGTYHGALDYEVRYAGTVGIPGYNDYKIPFRFRIQNIKDYYATTASATEITESGTQMITILIAAALMVLLFVVTFFLTRKHYSRAGSPYEESPENSVAEGQETGPEADSASPKKKKARLKKWQVAVIFTILLALCLCFAGPLLSKPTTYPSTVKYLDGKWKNANILMTGTASASFLISFLPGDAGTSIANELARITSYILLIISTIILEKYLLTSIGFVAGFIIPAIAYIMGMLWLFLQNRQWKKLTGEYAIRLVIFGFCIALIIPLGCACGYGIEALNSEPITKSIHEAEKAKEIVDQLPANEQDKGIIGNLVTSALNGLKGALEWLTDLFHGIVQSAAVMLITTLVIPVLIFFAFIWLIRFLTKRDYTGTVRKFSRRFANRGAAKMQTAAIDVRSISQQRNHRDNDSE